MTRPGRRLLIISLILLAGLTAACAAARPAPPSMVPASLPTGIAAGDVDQTSVVLWARSTVTGAVRFDVGTDLDAPAQTLTAVATTPSKPVTVTVGNLTAGVDYRYRVTTPAGEEADGSFRTAAQPDAHRGLRFGVSGDWRGGLAPFVALRNVPERELDFFVSLGDTVYADLASPAVPLAQATTLDDFRRKHAEVYSTVSGINLLAALRASTAIYATIDDHELTNDFAGGAQAARDARFVETDGCINQTALYANALTAFLEYNPLRAERYAAQGSDRCINNTPRLYRYRLFGLDAALYLLDARSFRDLPVRHADRTNPADMERFRIDTFRSGRTMLGSVQLADLKRDLLDAQELGVTWKFIAIPEPAQHRGLISAQDRFEGYAAERADLLRFIETQQIDNVVFIAADIHGTLVNNLTYSLEPGGDQRPLPSFEITTGPVAYWPTLGSVVITDGRNKGYVSDAEAAIYATLPIANDADNRPDDRDDFVKAIIDRELVAAGFDPLGLQGSPVEAELLDGDYVAFHTYGWTEFEVDIVTQALTVTTYGIPPYRESDRVDEMLTYVPQVVSRFRVEPVE